MKSRLLLAFLALASVTVAAQSPAPAPGPERRVFAVSVLDKEGRPVEGLTAANFRGEYRGQPVKILSVEPDTRPRGIAIMVDTSGSARGRADLIWAVARDAAATLVPGNDVVLLTVGQDVQFRTGLTGRGPEEVDHRLSQARAAAEVKGSTAIYDGMIRAAWAFPPGRFADVLYVVSDMMDNASQADWESVASELSRTGVRAHIAWFDPPEGGRLLRAASRVRKQLAELSGGMTVDLRYKKVSKVGAAAQPLYNSIKFVDRLEVELPQPVDEARDWKLEVLGADGKKLKDVTVAYPRLLVPLAEPAPDK